MLSAQCSVLSFGSVAVNTFQDIQAWQAAHRLVLEIYQFTQKFPPAELFGLTSQLRRAAVSVALNIAEGFKRNSRIESIRFYNMAASSLEEVKCAVLIARDLHYCSVEDYGRVSAKAEETGRILYGWINSQRPTKHA